MPLQVVFASAKVVFLTIYVVFFLIRNLLDPSRLGLLDLPICGGVGNFLLLVLLVHSVLRLVLLILVLIRNRDLPTKLGP